MQGHQCIGNAAPNVIVSVKFNAHRRIQHLSNAANDILHLHWRCDANGVCNPNTVHPKLPHTLVDQQCIINIAPECVFATESNLFPGILDIIDHLFGNLNNLMNSLTMGMFRKDWGGGHVYIDTIHPTVHSQLHIVHRASRVGENLCLKPQRRNLRKVLIGCLACSWVCQLNVVDSHLVKIHGNIHAVIGSKIRGSKLLAFPQRGVNDPKWRQRATRCVARSPELVPAPRPPTS
mmetsp:Transcript_5574/g.10132  ORF Transcript_5574/g.10132 Transcript_5574/m.10132 type:complete len:234 (+) Transcript_5574:2018-2719(+)